MSKFDVSIFIQNQSLSIFPGLQTGDELYRLGNISPENYTLSVDVSNEVDMPIHPDDVLIVKGGERLVVSQKFCNNTSSNFPLHTPIPFFLNGVLYTESNAFQKIKITTRDLENILDNNQLKFIVDIDGLSDVILPDNKNIIVGPNWSILTITDNVNCEPTDREHCDDVNSAHKYKIRIDDEKYIVHVSKKTGRDILLLAGKENPEQYDLYQLSKDGSTKIVTLDEKVDFSCPGIERFITIPRDMTEGLEVRRQFRLPANDEMFLNGLNLIWEAVIDAGVRRVVIHDLPLPVGYTNNTVVVNMRIESGYPESQIDMAYFFPSIARANGKPINAISSDIFDGKEWQRWSRHRTSENPWRPGLDNVGTHVAAIHTWLITELDK
ncbi:MAG: multiubiquitin domain-containing protein [Pseudomonadota bacterium]